MDILFGWFFVFVVVHFLFRQKTSHMNYFLAVWRHNLFVYTFIFHKAEDRDASYFVCWYIMHPYRMSIVLDLICMVQWLPEKKQIYSFLHGNFSFVMINTCYGLTVYLEYRLVLSWPHFMDQWSVLKLHMLHNKVRLSYSISLWCKWTICDVGNGCYWVGHVIQAGFI